MARSELRNKARSLRIAGQSIKSIAQSTGASLSSVSYWCRDITLKPNQIRALAAKQRRAGTKGRLIAAERKRMERLAAVAAQENSGKTDVASVSKRDLFILGLGLYWAEGYKNGNEECGLTNSDPDIIRAFIRWLKSAYGISVQQLVARVSVNTIHKDRIDEIESYWSRRSKIPRSQFTTASFLKTIAKKTYSNRDRHFGTLRVKVRRGTSLRRRIIGSIKEIRSQIR